MAGSKVPMDVKPAGNAAPVASLPRPNSLLSSVDCDARRQQSDRWCQETQVMIAMPELKLSRLLESELAKNRGGCDRAVIVFEAVDGFGKLLDRRGIASATGTVCGMVGVLARNPSVRMRSS